MSSATVDVEATSEGQEYTETLEGETYGVESNLNGGSFEPAYLDGNPITGTLSGGVEGETTE